MQKIAIIGNGSVAEKFLERVSNGDNEAIFFDIVTNGSSHHKKHLPTNACLYSFDPTSEHKLKKVPLKEARVIFVVMDDEDDTKAVAKIARSENQNATIVVLDGHNLEAGLIDSLKLKTVNSQDIISNMLMSFMPNTPLIAQNIGKGRGEIMEVMVPYGSKYVFRHISNVEQKNWKIAAVYRNEQLILPKQSTMIRPQDELILIGQPAILRDVYKAIKSEIGHFPLPFGANIYLLLNAAKLSEAKAKRVVCDSLLLHEKLNSKKLFIKAFNINSSSIIEYLRGIGTDDVIVEFDYRNENPCTIVKTDIKKYNIGLAMCDGDIFTGDLKKTLHELKKPVLKFGKNRFFDESYSTVVATHDLDLEKISYVFFDMSLQLKMKLKLFEYDPEENENNEVAEHYISLSDVYGVKLQVEKESKNFLREYRGLGNFIQFLPFTEEHLKVRLKDFLNPSNGGLFSLIKDRHQVFIPIND